MNDMANNISYHQIVRLMAQSEVLSPDQLPQLVASLNCLGTDEWNRCINALCRRYGARSVLEHAIAAQADFLERFRPDSDIFPVCNGAIRRIGVLCHKGHGGGAECATMLWISHMRRLGFHVVWLPDRDSEADERFALDSDSAKRADQLLSCISSEHLDLVLLVDHWRTQVFHDLLFAKMAGVRVVIAEHNAYFFPLDDANPALYLMRQNLYPLADVVTVLSAENAAWWHSVGFHNVVQMPNFLTYGDDFEKRVPLAEPKGRFLCVGRICNRKNQCDVVSAFARYLKKGTVPESSRLMLLGRFESAKDEDDIRLLIKRLGVESHIELHGEVLDTIPYYKNADVLLMASRLEGAPMVINEAKSYGLPTVMYELPYVEGTREAEGVVSVPAYDVQAMANAMYRCMVDGVWYAHLSSAALDSLKRYSGDALEKRWLGLFEVLESDGNQRDELNSFCVEVSEQRMFSVTMKAVGALVPALYAWQKAVKAIVEARDKAYAEKDAAWKAHDRVEQERNEVWSRLDAEKELQKATIKERDEARQALALVEQERNEAWSRLDAEQELQKAIMKERDEARQALALVEQKCAAQGLTLEKIRASLPYKAYHFLKSFWARR